MKASCFYILVLLFLCASATPVFSVSHVTTEPSPSPSSEASPSDTKAISNPSSQELYDLLEKYKKEDPESEKKLKETLEKLGITDKDLKTLEKISDDNEKLKHFKSENGSKPFSNAPKDFYKQIQKLFPKASPPALKPAPQKTPEATAQKTQPLMVENDGTVKITDAKSFEKILNSHSPQTDQALKDTGLGRIVDPDRKAPIQVGDSLVMPKDENGNYKVLDANETESWRKTQEQNAQDLARVTGAGVSFPETKDPQTGQVSRSLKIEDPQTFLPKLRSDVELAKALDRQFDGLGTKILIQSAHEDAVTGTSTPVDNRIQYLPWMQKATFEAYKKADQGIAPTQEESMAPEIRGALNGLASIRQTERVLQQSGANLNPEQQLKFAEAKALVANQIGLATEKGRLTQEFRNAYWEQKEKQDSVGNYQDLYAKYREEHPNQKLPQSDVVTRLNVQNRIVKDLNDLIAGKSDFGDLSTLIKNAANVSGTGFIDVSGGISWNRENQAVRIMDSLHKRLLSDAKFLDEMQVAPELAMKMRNLSSELGNLHSTLTNRNADEYVAKVKREVAFAALSVASLGAGQLIAMGARAGQATEALQAGQKAYQSFKLAETSVFTLKEGAKFAVRNASIGASIGGGLYSADSVAKYIDDSRKYAADTTGSVAKPKFDFSLKGLGVETLKGGAIGAALGLSPVAAEAAGAYFTVTSIKAGTDQWQNGEYAQSLTNLFGGQVVAPWAVQKINSHVESKAAVKSEAAKPVEPAKPVEQTAKAESKPAVWSERPALSKDQLADISTKRQTRFEELNRQADAYQAEGKNEAANKTRKQAEDLKLENDAFEHYRKLAEAPGSKYEILASGEEFHGLNPKTGEVSKRGDIDLAVRYDGKPVIVEFKNVGADKARNITTEQIDKLKADPIMNAADANGQIAGVVVHAPKLAPIQPLAEKGIISVDGKVIADSIKRLGTEITIGFKQLEAYIRFSDPVKAIEPGFKAKAEEVGGRKLTDAEARVLEKSHQIGKDEPGQFKGNYPSEVLQEKYSTAVEGLMNRGVPEKDAHSLVKKLMVEGVLGKEGPALKVGETFTAKDVERLRVGDVVELTSIRDNSRKAMVVGLEKNGIQVMGADGKGRTVYYSDQLQSGTVVRPSEGTISGPIEGRVSSQPKNGREFQAGELFPAEKGALAKVPNGADVTFKSRSGNEYEGKVKGLTPDGKQMMVQGADGKTFPLNVDRLALGKIKEPAIPDYPTLPPEPLKPAAPAAPTVDNIPAVAEGPYAKMLRSQALYERTPGYQTREQQKLDAAEVRRSSNEFHEKSSKVSEIFSDWLAKSGPKETVGALLDKMQDAYYQYPREQRGNNMNTRGKVTQDFAADRFGLEANGQGRVKLPGIEGYNAPGFASEQYFYPNSADWAVRAQYEASLTNSLKDYATRMGELEAMKRDGKSSKNSPEYVAKENEVFKAISDFGQVAAHYRPYKNGNWGLFGPAVNTMVNRMGYEIRNPGYLDILFQGAKVEGFSTFFGDQVRSGKPFYTEDGYNAVKGRTVPLVDTSTPRGRAQLKQMMLGNAPDNFNRPGMAGPRGLPDENGPRR